MYLCHHASRLTNKEICSNTKKMKSNLLIFFLLLNGCSWFNRLSCTMPIGPTSEIVIATLKHYNAYNEAAYSNMFDSNINYFVSNGISTTRFASGKEEFIKFNRALFKMKKNQTEAINMFASGDWVFVQQRTKTPGGTIEASIGYRINKNKITEMMVIGETRLD